MKTKKRKRPMKAGDMSLKGKRVTCFVVRGVHVDVPSPMVVGWLDCILGVWYAGPNVRPRRFDTRAEAEATIRGMASLGGFPSRTRPDLCRVIPVVRP